MVLPVHESGSREWRQWKGLAKWLSSASGLFAVVWWLVSRDARGSLMAALVPWGLALGCLVIVMLWSIVLVPLLVLIARFGGVPRKRQP